jgi:hypothetical protein
MEKLTFFISLFLISLILIMGTFISSPLVLAKSKIEKSPSLNQFSIPNHDPVNFGHPKSYQDSSILLPLTSSGITTDLTSSFSNIINTQIFTGLNE